MPEMGQAGSIGCVMLHADYSRKLANDGVAVTVLSSGAHKASGNPFEPLPPAVAAGIRTALDRGRDLFAEAVGRYRGKRLTKEKALATEAAVYLGREAVDVAWSTACSRRMRPMRNSFPRSTETVMSNPLKKLVAPADRPSTIANARKRRRRLASIPKPPNWRSFKRATTIPSRATLRRRWRSSKRISPKLSAPFIGEG